MAVWLEPLTKNHFARQRFINGFKSRLELWILSCEETIQLCYGTSVVLHRRSLVLEGKDDGAPEVFFNQSPYDHKSMTVSVQQKKVILNPLTKQKRLQHKRKYSKHHSRDSWTLILAFLTKAVVLIKWIIKTPSYFIISLQKSKRLQILTFQYLFTNGA